MSQSLADIILHIVFSTKDRQPWIEPEIESELFAYICGICHKLGCIVIRINGTSDHIHILLLLGRTASPSKLISGIKSNSSRWIKTKGRCYQKFAWQNGFAAFSVSRPAISKVINYVTFQKKHHKTVTYKSELLSILEKAQVNFRKEYLWD